jgi:branched-chain amino acid transport system permease protein
MGSLAGAVVGGFFVGFLSVLLQTYLPAELRGFRDAFLFGAVILVLVWRPRGLIASRTTFERV